MITYIEGVDGSGKSTLIQKLKEKYGAIQLEIPGRSLDEWKSWCDINCSYRKWPQIFVADRSLISELVYRMEDKKDTFLTKELLQKFLIGAQFVYCVSKTSYDDAIDRGDDNIESHTQHVNREVLYDGIFHTLETIYKIPVLRYDWHSKKMSNVIEFLKRTVNTNAI